MKPNKAKEALVTAEMVREIFDYDAETGVLTYAKRVSNAMRAGMVAGSLTNFGYINVIIDGRGYRAHRLIWLWAHGKWPEHEIDHKDGVRSRNALSNLREATRAANMLNKRIYANNSTGFPGVTFEASSGKYRARFGCGGKAVNVGRFDTAEEASAAYQAAIAYRGEFRPQAASSPSR